MDFQQYVRPCKADNGFRMDDWAVWCGSAVRGPDGATHLFASRWPKRPDATASLGRDWLLFSEVVRAESPNVDGPFEFKEVVLGPSTPDRWNGRMNHNPTVHRFGDKYYLYHIGTTWDDENEDLEGVRHRQRIGVAVADDPRGPWTQYEGNPILDVRPDKWDCSYVTNPAVCMDEDGKVWLYYKARDMKDRLLKLGVATGPTPVGPFTSHGDAPLFDYADEGSHVEDPYVWRRDGRFWMILKDMTGAVAGAGRGSGMLLYSEDGFEWKRNDPLLAWRKELRYADGAVEEVQNMERPQLLIEDGAPLCAYFAIRRMDGELFNAAIPLA